ncbi:RpiB/LacA/LacB family sugar-phosphate isomerase [Candidatus Woesearchaeota archaeon]|nr:RpiB/LacA/LacB family sugar-phosphate isomerase [Candidatus Woesearchaeota archaeon]
MKVYLGADHAGFFLKEKIKKFLKNVVDLGNKRFEINDDYPIYAAKVAKAVAKNKKSFGILICGSGQGVAIAANKVKGIRAIVAENVKDAYLARKDDDANILCLSGRTLSLEKAKRIIKKFAETKFENIPKRARRLKEIRRLEQ